MSLLSNVLLCRLLSKVVYDYDYDMHSFFHSIAISLIPEVVGSDNICIKPWNELILELPRIMMAHCRAGDWAVDRILGIARPFQDRPLILFPAYLCL